MTSSDTEPSDGHSQVGGSPRTRRRLPADRITETGCRERWQGPRSGNGFRIHRLAGSDTQRPCWPNPVDLPGQSSATGRRSSKPPPGASPDSRLHPRPHASTSLMRSGPPGGERGCSQELSRTGPHRFELSTTEAPMVPAPPDESWRRNLRPTLSGRARGDRRHFPRHQHRHRAERSRGSAHHRDVVTPHARRARRGRPGTI